MGDNSWMWVLAVLLVFAGLAGTVLPALPGVPLVFAGLLLGAWADGFVRVGPLTLILLGVFTALSFAIDFAAAALGAKRVGATKYAIIGAALGTLTGIFFGLPGLLIGPFAGAVTGEPNGQLWRVVERGLNDRLNRVEGRTQRAIDVEPLGQEPW